MIEIYYEVHSEVDGHVTGSYDREYAEQRMETLTDETGHDHHIIEREEAV
jgi:tetrahydromethanopterin S-methyltransferase subunit H